ncbi:MAG: hypothetical protein SFW63_03440 [Alphaproteobacteria bacterium]|nr:hypothetical protein [Alphaproteobacteria bacterium]
MSRHALLTFALLSASLATAPALAAPKDTPTTSSFNKMPETSTTISGGTVDRQELKRLKAINAEQEAFPEEDPGKAIGVLPTLNSPPFVPTPQRTTTEMPPVLSRYVEGANAGANNSAIDPGMAAAPAGDGVLGAGNAPSSTTAPNPAASGSAGTQNMGGIGAIGGVTGN